MAKPSKCRRATPRARRGTSYHLTGPGLKTFLLHRQQVENATKFQYSAAYNQQADLLCVKGPTRLISETPVSKYLAQNREANKMKKFVKQQQAASNTIDGSVFQEDISLRTLDGVW